MNNKGGEKTFECLARENRSEISQEKDFSRNIPSLWVTRERKGEMRRPHSDKAVHSGDEAFRTFMAD